MFLKMGLYFRWYSFVQKKRKNIREDGKTRRITRKNEHKDTEYFKETEGFFLVSSFKTKKDTEKNA